jgi:adenylate cyclase
MDKLAKILVVDDVSQNVKLLKDVLEAKGFQVATAFSGQEALDQFEAFDPDLVLLDVVMPGINGLDVCREIRSRPGTALLPVVLVTALDSSADRVAGIDAGADDFLTKPIDLQELLARVGSLLRIRSLVKTVERQAEELEAWNRTLEEKVDDKVNEVERLTRFRRFLSPQVADVVLSGGGDSMLRSHRREIATLFCDLRGFTAFAESVDPEESMDALRRYHDEMGLLIDAAGGTIACRAGDGIMIIFNDPVTCDEPAMRAIDLALAMRSKMGKIIVDWHRFGFDLGFGMGVTLGYATLGLIGNKSRFDYTAYGSTVNLAARLCEAAASGQILINTKAQVMTETIFEVVEEPSKKLKGFRDLVSNYNVLGRQV